MIKYPQSKWTYNWGIDKHNAESLYKHIIDTKPKIILETGTFEAQATYVMAKACNDNNNNAVIYTIDYDGDPTSNLDKSEWLKLKDIRNSNLQNINNEFKNVEINFIEGDSREVLKDLFINKNITNIDLFYQDSMHFIEGIQSEWNLVEQYIHMNSYIIFDDLQLKGVQAFRKWFIKQYNKQYEYTIIESGHKQFMVKKK